MTEKLKILAISGSLRRASFNTMVLHACQKLAPDDVSIEIFDRLGEIPLYNEDLRAEGFPPAAADLRARIAAADAILIATPEYNHSLPGALKNAIDWASRPPEIPLAKKSFAILGASMGAMGTIRAQYHLRDILIFFDGTVVNKPEVFIGQAQNKFNAQGDLTDEPTANILRMLLEALKAQTLRLRASGPGA
jgi:chromate reductase